MFHAGFCSLLIMNHDFSEWRVDGYDLQVTVDASMQPNNQY